MAYRKITSKQIEKAREMHSQGKTYGVICDLLGVGYGTVRRALDSSVREKNRRDCAAWNKTHKKETSVYDAARRRAHKREEKVEHLGRSATAISGALKAKTRKEKNKRACTKWKRTHRIQSSLYQSEYYKTHREKKLAYYATHKEEAVAYRKVYKKKMLRRKVQKEKRRLYAHNHRAQANARTAAWYARRLKATTGDLKAIEEIYCIAKNGLNVHCYICGKPIPIGQRHVDHIIPLSKGGPHRPSNLAVACAKCNHRKYNKLPEEMGILL